MNDRVFLKKGNDPFIDFVKGFAIIGVIILHNLGHTFISKYALFNLWIGQSVPLFILISSVNSYRKYIDADRIYISAYFKDNSFKIVKRVLIPYLILQLCYLPLDLTLGNGTWGGGIVKIVETGGLGPGSYYPWVQIQIFILFPFVCWIRKKNSLKFAFVMTILVAQILEVWCSMNNCGEDVWRMLSVRYIFMITIGIYVMERGFYITLGSLVLSLIGIIFILLDSYSNMTFYPLIFKSFGFEGQHWIAYFYTGFTLLFILKAIHRTLPQKISALIQFYGKDSYSIFLIQLGVFYMIRTMQYDVYNISLKMVVFVIVSTLLSLAYSTFKYYKNKQIK